MDGSGALRRAASLTGLMTPCGRVPAIGLGRSTGAEGATAPEPLRPQDHGGEATLERTRQRGIHT